MLERSTMKAACWGFLVLRILLMGFAYKTLTAHDRETYKGEGKIAVAIA